MAEGVCAIIGHGPGLGRAYARAFHGAGYDLALLSRSGAGLDDAGERPAVAAYPCDAGDAEALTAALERVERDLGPVDVLIHNADIARFGALEEIAADQFEQSWQVAALGLFAAARLLGPRMAERGAGTILVSGATASLRGNVWTTAFAPAKAAQRVLAQSLAKQLGPRGVHVAYLVIDGVIDTEDTRTNFAPDAPDDFFLQPDRIAEAALMLTRQHRSAWTFELDLRPFGEKW
ncbi:SDR family NAD(P)-dependent oxidoreductase [Psychromarinibacter sp. C21-152]|uniref:SDR family NAD(P)-dependent oxidoreductase n=1 Tax=Psychromarinibacter sediminicola TaxID=3033385 RepID=A0AAE3T8Y3_9RHOB|nr:SDR family NAD(P)-dependent oxidoreductase [Psychromarinibacter sediminicola]MDF0600519.1 SDR family NAD(P)-dependent oxidoreductase [Psychromarinibacter sediminicola]